MSDYWANILGTYGYDLSDDGINYEKAGDLRIEDYVRDLYIANEGAVAGGVASISGITSGTMTGEDGVDREYIQIVINGIDPTAIFKMGIEVAPMHYYTKSFTGTLNIRRTLNDPAFMEVLKSKNVAPMGAGPYIVRRIQGQRSFTSPPTTASCSALRKLRASAFRRSPAVPNSTPC